HSRLPTPIPGGKPVRETIPPPDLRPSAKSAGDSLCGFAPLRENKSQKNSIISVEPTEGAYVRISKFCNEPYPPVETGGYNIDRAYGSQNFAMNLIPRLKPGATI